MTNLFARLRSGSLKREIDALAKCYATQPVSSERERDQLERLNRVWQDIRLHVPYYAAVSRDRNLPARWESLQQFVELVPITGRAALQEHRQQMTSTRRPPQRWSATGGSTAQPIQIPHWKIETETTRPNQWIGRSWYGVAPDARLFLLWGHSHVLGTGFRGWFKARRREIDDRMLGYCRYSAYDLSESAMHAAVKRILEFRPTYLLGYSVALDRLERVASAYRTQLRSLGIKVVIGTSESFPYPDSEQRLSDTFGCPVAMEYAAVEAMGLSHSHPAGGYRLFWQSYLAEAAWNGGNRWVLRLTSLYPRSMPLVRYEIGDEVELAPGSPDHVVGVTHFERVLGRCNQFVELRDGTVVHSEVFSHAVRPCTSVRGFQVVQANGSLRLRVATKGELPAEEEAGLRQRLGVVHSDLAGVALERVDALVQTVAGKTPMIIRL